MARIDEHQPRPHLPQVVDAVVRGPGGEGVSVAVGSTGRAPQASEYRPRFGRDGCEGAAVRTGVVQGGRARVTR